MARRKHSIAEDIIDLSSKLPWWGGIILALISYVLLHHYATQQPVSANFQDVGAAAQSTMITTFATFGQYFLPALLGLGAVVSFINGFKRKTLLPLMNWKTGDFRLISWKFVSLLHQWKDRHDPILLILSLLTQASIIRLYLTSYLHRSEADFNSFY